MYAYGRRWGPKALAQAALHLGRGKLRHARSGTAEWLFRVTRGGEPPPVRPITGAPPLPRQEVIARHQCLAGGANQHGSVTSSAPGGGPRPHRGRHHRREGAECRLPKRRWHACRAQSVVISTSGAARTSHHGGPGPGFRSPWRSARGSMSYRMRRVGRGRVCQQLARASIPY